MTDAQTSLSEVSLHLRMQIEQSQRISDHRSALTYPLGYVLLSQRELLGQAPVGVSLLDGIEVFTLQVFDQRKFEHISVCGLPDDDRRFLQSELTGCSPAPFSGD